MGIPSFANILRLIDGAPRAADTREGTMNVPGKRMGESTGDVPLFGPPAKLSGARRSEAAFKCCQTSGPAFRACKKPRNQPASARK